MIEGHQEAYPLPKLSPNLALPVGPHVTGSVPERSD